MAEIDWKHFSLSDPFLASKGFLKERPLMNVTCMKHVLNEL
jgi:hypothetical protein